MEFVQIQIGKQGITDELITHVDELMDDKKSVKIKFLKSSLANGTRQELAEYISSKLHVKGKLVGNTVAFVNKRK